MRRLAAKDVLLTALCTAAFVVPQSVTAEDDGRERPLPRMSLDGEWLYSREDHEPPAELPLRGWRARNVPSNAQRDQAEPGGVIWFAREVELPRTDLRYAVEFQGVDYRADVYWDGRLLGRHVGYFEPFSFALPRATPGTHVLAVRVDCPVESKTAWSLHKQLIKGVLGHHDTRPGNAWSDRGQEASTGGIWGHVSAYAVHESLIESPRVTTTALAGRVAELSISVMINGPADRRVRYRVWDPQGHVVGAGTMKRAAGAASSVHRLDDVQPWWPRELGEPALYEIEILVDAPGGHTDVRRERFGIRTVRQDAAGRFLINDTPIFLRGTNYIPTLYFADFDERTLDADFALMEAAHINAVRVHAHVSLPAFYRAADERGLLVMQDFPLQWGYDDSAEFAREAARQARAMVTTLYNHPSVITWTGMNEAPFSSEWMKWKYPDYDPDQNRLLERAVAEALSEADTSRPSYGNSDPGQHVWAGWYDGNYHRFANPQRNSLVTEFGAQALPSVSTLQTFIPPPALWPIEKNLALWEYHGFQLRELKEIAKVSLGASLQEAVDNTQQYQARLLQFAIEHLRAQKWQPVTGVFQFMLVEHWASTNWGIVDYLRHPKLGYSALARAYQPVLPVALARDQGKRLKVFLINDTSNALKHCKLHVRRVPEGAPPTVIPAEVPAGQVVALDVRIPGPAAHEAVVLELFDQSDELLSRNAYSPGYFAP